MSVVTVQMTIVDLPSADRTVPVAVVCPLSRQTLLAAASKKFKAVSKQSRVYNGITGVEFVLNAEVPDLHDAFVVFSGKAGWKGAARLGAAFREAAAADPAEAQVVTPQDEEQIVQDGIDQAALFEASHSQRSVGVVLFWKETQRNGYLSNWATSPLDIKGVRYNCVEQWIMAEKARACKDDAVLLQVMQARSPRKQKGLGRSLDASAVHRFWRHRRKWEAQMQGARAKFSQSPTLAARLLRTGEKSIAEASPSDRVFGIGLAPDNPLAQDPANWQGQNLLGKALMEVRTELRQRILSGQSLEAIGADAAELVEEVEATELQSEPESASSEQDEEAKDLAGQDDSLPSLLGDFVCVARCDGEAQETLQRGLGSDPPIT